MIWLGSCTGSRCADHRRMNNVVSASTSDHLVSYASSLAELLYFSCGWHVHRRCSRVVHALRRWEATRLFTSCFLQGSYWETVLPSSTWTLSSRPQRVGRLLQHGVSSGVEMKNIGFWTWKNDGLNMMFLYTWWWKPWGCQMRHVQKPGLILSMKSWPFNRDPFWSSLFFLQSPHNWEVLSSPTETGPCFIAQMLIGAVGNVRTLEKTDQGWGEWPCNSGTY